MEYNEIKVFCNSDSLTLGQVGDFPWKLYAALLTAQLIDVAFKETAQIISLCTAILGAHAAVGYRSALRCCWVFCWQPRVGGTSPLSHLPSSFTYSP